MGVKAAARPNAHAHIKAIAAYCLALAGRVGEARAHMAAIHKTLPHYRVDDFLPPSSSNRTVRRSSAKARGASDRNDAQRRNQRFHICGLARIQSA